MQTGCGAGTDHIISSTGWWTTSMQRLTERGIRETAPARSLLNRGKDTGCKSAPIMRVLPGPIPNHI